MPRALGRPLRLSWSAGAAALQGLFFLSYPFVIYAAHLRLGTRGVGAILLGLYALSLLLRMRGAGSDLWRIVRQHAALAALIAAAMAFGNRTLLLMLPMLVSLYLLATFGWTLHRGPPMIERFARAFHEGDLPGFTLPYCRKVTWLWCGFLAANAAAVGVLAVAAPLGWWALYTGGLFYGLLAVLLVGEFVFRKWWFRYFEDGAVDRLLARCFRPERTANGRRSLAYVERRRALAAGAGGGSPARGASSRQ